MPVNAPQTGPNWFELPEADQVPKPRAPHHLKNADPVVLALHRIVRQNERIIELLEGLPSNAAPQVSILVDRAGPSNFQSDVIRRRMHNLVVYAFASGGTPATTATLQTGTVGANNAVRWTAIPVGVGGNAITVAIVIAGTNTAASVGVSGTAITFNSATDATGLATSTAAQMIAAIQGSGPASALVSVAAVAPSNGTGLVTALAATNLSGGTASIGPTATINVLDGPIGTTPMLAADNNATRTVTGTAKYYVCGVCDEIVVQANITSGVFTIGVGWAEGYPRAAGSGPLP